MTNSQIRRKYLQRLSSLKENRAETFETNTDGENYLLDKLIELTAEICRDLRPSKLTLAQKVERVKNLYDINDICDVLGYGGGWSESAFSKDDYNDLENLEVSNPEEFCDRMYREAAINGNFEEAIKLNVKLPI